MFGCLSYSIFGYGVKHDNSFEFSSYLRGLEFNLRVARLLYDHTQWAVSVVVDQPTYNSPFKEFFDYHKQNGYINLTVVAPQPLCKMMLHRLYPIYEVNKYDRVLCRDTDSLLSFKERQCVELWVQGGRACHAMADSISHTTPLMGGMVGFKSYELRQRMTVRNWAEFIDYDRGIDFSRKGSDQVFMDKHILPRVADSITEHFFLGMPNTFRGDYHQRIDESMSVAGVKEECRELNGLGFHIGAAGFSEPGVIKFLKEHGIDNPYYEQIEKKFASTFYWHL